jgi:predicted nucleic-acid-binding Zn-ribbon protein
MGYAKVKEKKEVGKMDTKVSKILKIMGTKIPTIKKREKKGEIAPVLSQKCFKCQQERYVSRSIIELG